MRLFMSLRTVSRRLSGCVLSMWRLLCRSGVSVDLLNTLHRGPKESPRDADNNTMVNHTTKFRPVVVTLVFSISFLLTAMCGTAVAGFGSIDTGGGPTQWWEGYSRDENGMLIGINPDMLNGKSAHALEFCLERIRGKYVYTEIVTLYSKSITTFTCANARRAALRAPGGWSCSRSNGGPMRGGRLSCGNGNDVGSTHVKMFGIKRGMASLYTDIAYPRYTFTGCGIYVLEGRTATHYSRSTCLGVNPATCDSRVGIIVVCSSSDILIPGDPGAKPAVALGKSYYLPKALRAAIDSATTR